MSNMAPAGEETLSPDEKQFIQDAAEYLENPSYLMQIADMFGKPLAYLTQGIDYIAPDVVDKATNAALRNIVSTAVWTIPQTDSANPTDDTTKIADVGVGTDFWHKVSVAVTGTAGGFFGVWGLPMELPVTTGIMFRSIASIAKDFGERLDDEEFLMQCLTVFSFGGPGKETDAMESSYLSARAGLATMIKAAAKAVAGKTAAEIATMVQKGTAPMFVNLIARIAARFNVVVTEKLVAQSLPLVGAATGATVNVAFIDHFNKVAKFHFGIRSLERKCGLEHVQTIYRDAVRSAKISKSDG